MIYAGIDPGISGALAFIFPNGNITFRDTPIMIVKSGKKKHAQMDLVRCVAILEAIKNKDQVSLTIEKVNAMPSTDDEKRQMGVTSAFNFGAGWGMWLGIIAALRIPYCLVHPITWKKYCMRDMGKGKDASRVRACQLFPQAGQDLDLKKHHARADALLMADWGRKVGWREMKFDFAS